MTYPGHPTHVGDLYRYGSLDPVTGAWFFQRQTFPVGGEATWVTFGYVFDDTTPGLAEAIAAALAIAEPKGWIVVVLVGPGDVGLHHEGCVNFFEAYWKCLGPTLLQYVLRFARKRNRYQGYVMARRYGLQDEGGGPVCVPTRRQYLWLRKFLALLRPKYGLWDF